MYVFAAVKVSSSAMKFSKFIATCIVLHNDNTNGQVDVNAEENHSNLHMANCNYHNVS